ncbi:response regulator transcription factor [Streptomyces sp. NPDC085932]|uniref:response regulator transcription factor n=1 Tax=Streptomyces sp. NPDC085932 TaxID=3365741 RepID=UPI0037D11FDF
MSRVLVVDDDPAIRRSLDRALRLKGFTVHLASDGQAALADMAVRPTDILVLDVALPDMNGTDVCRLLRESGDHTPVLMLSALDEVGDRVTGLEAGADDYLVKPFALQELVLRLQALLRRSYTPVDDVLCVEDLIMNPATRETTYFGAEITLTGREFELLLALAHNAGRVLTRDQLLERVWGYGLEIRTDVVDTFISYLRRKLEADGRPRLIHTIRGLGFILRCGNIGGS